MKVVVIGGGVHGLCTAEVLSTITGVNVTLIEQYDPMHALGSSHGLTRITRSTYADPLYVELMQYAHQEYWPELEQRLGTQFIRPVEGCFFGPSDGTIDAYAAAVHQAGANVARLTISQAKKRFPHFNFRTDDSILMDHTSGQILAGKLMRCLWNELANRSVNLAVNEKVHQIDGHKMIVRTQHRTIQADKIIVCAGPWVASLCPELQSRTQVVRQFVSYWKPQRDLPSFPVWVALGNKHTENWYGLPQSVDEGFKMAQHRLIGNDLPSQAQMDVPAEQLGSIREWATNRLSFPLGTLLNTETCLYTVTKDEDFIVDRWRSNENIIYAAGFSGHGFKFGPLIGRYLSALVTDKVSELSWFENADLRWKWTADKQ